jgi:dihydrodipicolinate reductase
MTKVAIIGAGKGGRALLEMFAGDPTVTILGVADVHELPKNEEQAQWTLGRTKAGHPTESHHVMARVAHFQELERRYIPGTDERLKGSAGFSEAKAH